MLCDYLKPYEDQAKQIIHDYYRGEVPFEIFCSESTAVDFVCTRIHLFHTGIFDEKSMHQSIGESLDDLVESTAENNRFFVKDQMEVITGSKASTEGNDTEEKDKPVLRVIHNKNSLEHPTWQRVLELSENPDMIKDIPLYLDDE